MGQFGQILQVDSTLPSIGEREGHRPKCTESCAQVIENRWSNGGWAVFGAGHGTLSLS
ncbi:hypothetical protein GCM10010372_50740 [Streptomyces tauricus]|nr:hypothetical protein GCM10010372_50740 [Streptomyces tauricus]